MSKITKPPHSSKSNHEELQRLANEGRHSEILSILDATAKERPLELWQLVLKSRSIQLDEAESLPFDTASQPLEEALEREADYLPALLDLAHFLDLHTEETKRAVETYVEASQLVMDHLLDALRGWCSAKDIDDESRKEILRTYNQLVDKLHIHGLDAGERARRIDWMDPDHAGDHEL